MDVFIGIVLLALMAYGFWSIVKFLFFRSKKDSIPKISRDQVIENENQQREKLNLILSEPFDPAPEQYEAFFMFFDTETTGFIPDNVDVKEFNQYPFPVQIAWAVFDYDGKLIKEREFILLQPIDIPSDAAKIHKITTQKMKEKGVDPIPVYEEFVSDLKSARYLIAHNLEYDDKVIKAEFYRKGLKSTLLSKKRICTMKKFKRFCDIPFPSGTGIKFPKLSEFAVCAFNAKIPPTRFSIVGGHDASVDVRVTAKCFFEMLHTWEEIQIERE